MTGARAPNILILGLAKSGTTGVYSAVKEAAKRQGDDWVFVFEPKRPEPLRALLRYAPDAPLLVKAMLRAEAALDLPYDHFGRRLLCVRDPRDVAVSHLLFRPLTRGSATGVPPGTVERFLAALREKERDPRSRSVVALHRLGDELGVGSSAFGNQRRLMRRMAELESAQRMQPVRYETFVDGRLDDLSAYLELEVTPTRTDPDSWLGHIPRSMGHGDWRNWFLAEDVAYFRPRFRSFMERYAYDDDWELAPIPRIDPETSSAHVERRLVERRAQVHGRSLAGRGTAGPVAGAAGVAFLRGRAEDGDVVSAYRLAEVLLRGGPVAPDPTEARHWAYRASIQGHAPAMELLSRMLRRGEGGPRDPAGARRWVGEAGRRPRRTAVVGLLPARARIGLRRLRSRLR